MTQADTQNGKTPRKLSDHIIADTSLFWRTWPWRDANPFRSQRCDLIKSDLIIATDKRFRPKLPKVLDQVVGEGIVIIDDKDHDF
jgi:hypothetical protein